MKKYAIIENGIVVNVAAWDGESEWSPAAGQTAVDLGDSGAWIGWSYADGVFTAPAQPDPEPEPEG